MQKIKLIALDLDDTTLRSDASLAPETAAAIAHAVKSGVEVVIASGRAFKSLPKAVLSIDGLRYAISSNGAAIESVADGERIMSFTLKPQSVDCILEVFKDERFEAFVGGQPYCDAEYYAEPPALRLLTGVCRVCENHALTGREYVGVYKAAYS